MKKLLFIFFTTLSVLSYGQFITNTGIQITNKTVLYTNGDWQNSGTLRNDGTIITSNSWQNSGTLDVNSTGGFVLQYAASKSFSPGSGSVKVGFIQKEGIGDAALTGKIYVTDSLKVVAGIIKANSAADTLGFFSTAMVYAANGSYVDGPMAWKGSGTNTLTFPTGKGGNYLPIKFNNATSKRVGVEVQAAPVGYIAGDAVESLTGFPYAWNVVTANVADLGDSIELQAPNALVLGITDPVVVQKVNTNEFESMGARSTSSDGTNTKMVSYSNGLKGLFSIANGYSGTTVGDQAELKTLYNTAGGSSWINPTGWANGDLNSFGVTAKGGRVTSIVMPNNNLQGTVPSSITNIAALKTLDLSNNKITSLPNLTVIPAMATPTATLNVSSNNLDFASLKENASLTGSVVYTNQAPVSVDFPNSIPVGKDTLMTIPVGGGITNQYQWKFKGRNDASYSPIAGANSNTYTVTAINRAKIGDYVLEITNPAVPGLVLTSGVNTLEATANISGKLIFGNSGVTKGKMQLFQITSSGAYDTIRFDANGVRNPDPNGSIKAVDVKSDGSYDFKNVLLRDYLINGFADTLVDNQIYRLAIPTWYTQTFLWEKADILFLEGNVSPLDIVSVVRPEHPSIGFGTLTGVFTEFEPDSKVLGKKPVKKAAVSVSRVDDGGRGSSEVLTLVDYLFTNDNGEFEFNKLEAAEYRINIQYPGYPMDTSPESFITIPIADNLFDRQLGVDAEVVNGKIFVRQLIITGWEEQSHELYAFPNPTTDYLYIAKQTEDISQSKFKLLDETGKVISASTQWSLVEKKWEMDVRMLNRGIYILKIETNGKIETLKIIVK